MKTFLLIIMGTLVASMANGQPQADPEIAKAVKSYSELGDQQDVEGLKNILHDQHRLVWHDGTKEPFVANKEMYIAKIASKEWGGDQRDVSIESVESFDGVNATVKAVMDGKVAQMRSLFSLIKVDGQWRIVGELVNATFK